MTQELSYIAVENVNGVATLRNSLKVPQKVKHEVTIDPAILLLGIYTQENENIEDLCSGFPEWSSG